MKHGAPEGLVGPDTECCPVRESQFQPKPMEKISELLFDGAGDSFLVRDTLDHKEVQVDPMTEEAAGFLCPRVYHPAGAPCSVEPTVLNVGLVVAEQTDGARDAEHAGRVSLQVDPQVEKTMEMASQASADIVLQPDEPAILEDAEHEGLINKGEQDPQLGDLAMSDTLLGGMEGFAGVERGGAAASPYRGTTIRATVGDQIGGESCSPTRAVFVRDLDDGLDVLSGLAGLFFDVGCGSPVEDVDAMGVETAGELRGITLGPNGPAVALTGPLGAEGQGELAFDRDTTFDLNVDYTLTEEAQMEFGQVDREPIAARLPLFDVGARPVLTSTGVVKEGLELRGKLLPGSLFLCGSPCFAIRLPGCGSLI